MENIALFSNSANLTMTIFTIVVLFFACLYAVQTDKIKASIWFLFIGLLIEFVAGAMESEILTIYNNGGHYEVWVFVQLMLLLIAMIFMALSASQLLIHNVPSSLIVIAITVAGLFFISFFVFISPDGLMVARMRQIFPLAGFAYLAVSLWSQTKQHNNSGYVFAALITSCITIFLILRLFGVEAVQSDSTWVVPGITYVLLSLAVIMIRVDAISKELDNTQEQVFKYNRRIEEIIKSSPFPIIISRLADDKIILANTNAIKLFGINPRELDRYRLRDFFADSENRQLLNERLEQEREVQDFEILVKTPMSDAPFWLLASANVIDYNYDVALYSAFQDITSRKNREALLKNQATRDPLTSLYNRRYFEEEVGKQILESKIDKSPYSVLMLDADFFKKVNDTYGHKVGDKVLIELANTTERALRENDIVARYGGEEFVVFLPKIPADQALVVANRLRESIAAAVVHSDDNRPVKFTVSIGVSSNLISDNIDTLIKTADEALYRAKQNGRNRVELFSAKDLQDFIAQGQVERKDASQNHHPIFDKENNVEISLLDGIETGNIANEKTHIEDKISEPKVKLLGIDEEDL